jgi:two-component system heavy metal sensor histidine kinase CusS
LSELAQFLNQMFDRLESAFNQIRRFAADASHELKTPISLVRLHSEKMLVHGGLSPEHQEVMQEQLEELARLNQIIDGLLFLSRAEANVIGLQSVRRDPALFLEAFRTDAEMIAEHAGCRFIYRHDGQGEVTFDEGRIRQVLLNLLTNAIHASPAGGAITLQSILHNEAWNIAVEDEGVGVSAENCEKIFDRFVRFQHTDTGHAGSGLGLAICKSIIDLHKGTIYASPRTSGPGLRVSIRLPARN